MLAWKISLKNTDVNCQWNSNSPRYIQFTVFMRHFPMLSKIEVNFVYCVTLYNISSLHSLYMAYVCTHEAVQYSYKWWHCEDNEDFFFSSFWLNTLKLNMRICEFSKWLKGEHGKQYSTILMISVMIFFSLCTISLLHIHSTYLSRKAYQ